MRHARLIAAALLAATPVAVAFAQADLAAKIANDPGAPEVNGAKGQLVQDPGVEGGTALRVAVARKGQTNWDSAVKSTVTKPVRAGDTLVLAFDARLHEAPRGATSVAIPYTAIQLKAAPYTGVVTGDVTVGPDWAYHRLEGKADRNYPAGALKATIQIANARQTIDFGPIVVLNMGQ
jgi:hypothetical protein